MSCDADTVANELMTSLLAGETFDIPDVDLDTAEFDIPDIETITPPVPLTNEQLTTTLVNGDGVFDKLMTSISNHLKGEFEKNRITGNDYSKVYLGAIESSIASAVQFLLGRDQAYYQAITAQMQARAATIGVVTARVQLETAKAQLMSARFEALNQKAGYALIKLKLATEEVTYCTAKFGLDNLAPLQKEMLEEQIEQTRAQTLDTRRDGATPVVGMIGKQKDLYTQQIISYQRDAEVKAAKLFTDAWITMKTIDEGLLPPSAFTNNSLDGILNTLKDNNDIGTVTAAPPTPA